MFVMHKNGDLHQLNLFLFINIDFFFFTSFKAYFFFINSYLVALFFASCFVIVFIYFESYTSC